MTAKPTAQPTPTDQSLNGHTKAVNDKAIALWIVLSIAGLMIFPWIWSEIKKLDASTWSFSSKPSAAVVLPILREDAWRRQAQGMGDYRKKDNIDYFIVDATPIDPETKIPRASEWIMPPDNWGDWEKQFVTEDASCRVWFQFFGRPEWMGPYGPNNSLPELLGFPRKWRVATRCPLRYYRTRPRD